MPSSSAGRSFRSVSPDADGAADRDTKAEGGHHEAAAPANNYTVTMRSSGARLFVELRSSIKFSSPSAFMKLLEQHGMQVLTFKLSTDRTTSTHCLQAEVQTPCATFDAELLEEIRRACSTGFTTAS